MMERYTENNVVNLSDYVLTVEELNLLSKGMNFCPTPLDLDPGEMRGDLDQFHRRLRLLAKFEDSTSEVPDILTTEQQNHCTYAFESSKFKKKSTFNPPGPPAMEAMILTNEIALNKRPEPKHPKLTNISKGERKAIYNLTKNLDIIIKPADKGSAVVVMNRKDYIAEGYKQLSDTNFYKKIDKDLTAQHMQEVQAYITKMYLNGDISDSVSYYLTDRECKTAKLYLLPKIHKGKIPPPGRPIVSANGCPTEKISQLVDNFLTPPTTIFIRSYVKDTTDFIKKLEAVGTLPPNCLLATLDVTSLYTNIPNKEGLDAAKRLLSRYRPEQNLKPSNQTIIELLEMVLSMNNFTFNGDNYIQVGGTAMGTKAAPGFANCFMGDFENQFVHPYRQQPLKYLRFLDDCFLIWQHSREDLDTFVNHMNTQMESIKFTMEVSESHVNFLDTTVRINPDNNTLETDLYCKPTDSHNYLLYNSAHPKKCKQSIPYSQFLRIRRICTKTSDYDRHIVTLSNHFLRRGYPLELLETAAITARRLDRNILLEPKNTPDTKSEEVILVTTYDPSQDLLREITKANWDYLGKSPLTTFIHKKKILVGYKRPKNLRDLLVKAECKLPKNSRRQTPGADKSKNLFLLETSATSTHPRKNKTIQSSILDFVNQKLSQDTPLHASISLVSVRDGIDTTITRSQSQTSIITPNMLRNKCISKKKCRYCPLLNCSGTIKCTVTGKIFHAKKNITCRSSNLVYCITCKKCDKQYVGQTKRMILERFQGHCYKISTYRTHRIETPNLFRQQDKDAVGTHFSAEDHCGTQDLIISVLAYITLPPQSEAALAYRLKVEKQWIHRMRCPAPTGLNILD